jgi:hypothetical protein
VGEFRNERGQFITGWKGGGRKPGSRTRLSETMLALIHADVAEHGAEVLATVRREKPAVWLQCVCSLLPKQVAIEKLSPLADLTDQELDELHQHLAMLRARTVARIEQLEGKTVTDPVIDDPAAK